MAENRRKSGQNGPADPAPAPALGEEEGHLEPSRAPPFPAPPAPEPPSTSTPANISANISVKNSTPTKRKPGRKKGCVKTGGRKKPGPEPSGREARKYLEQNSGYLDLLCRMLRGKPIKRQGPTGKLVWYHPDFDDQKWALAQVLPRMIPTLASQEITGDKDNPLSIDDNREPLSMTELARRTAFLLDLAARDGDETRRPVAASRGVTATGGGLPPSASAPAPTTPAPNEAHAPASSAFSPDIAGAYSDVYGWIEGGHAPTTADGQGAPQAAPEPDREPVPGEVATVGGYEIRCKENSRDNLPDLFEIFDDHGRQIRYPINGFQNALKKIRELADDVDMSVTITKPRPAFSQSRADERPARSISAPVLHGSYAHRKGN